MKRREDDGGRKRTATVFVGATLDYGKGVRGCLVNFVCAAQRPPSLALLLGLGGAESQRPGNSLLAAFM